MVELYRPGLVKTRCVHVYVHVCTLFKENKLTCLTETKYEKPGINLKSTPFSRIPKIIHAHVSTPFSRIFLRLANLLSLHVYVRVCTLFKENKLTNFNYILHMF
jgi:hypothetical protein